MPPSATTRLSSRIEAKQRLLLPSANGTLALVVAAMARSASRRVSASGFSLHTGLPSAATASIWRICSECGVARNTQPDARIGDRFVEVGRQLEALAGCEVRYLLGLLADAADDAQAAALALHGFDDALAPAAKADHGGVNHASPSWRYGGGSVSSFSGCTLRKS